MLKHTVTYTDFNDKEVTEDLYFNLAKNELVKMEVGADGGSLQTAIQKIIKSEDKKSLVAEFEKIILGAYGVKSEDGRHFIKSEEISQEFSQSAAYDALFTELITDETTVATFITGILPKDMAEMISKLQDQDKPQGPPKLLPPPPKTV